MSIYRIVNSKTQEIRMDLPSFSTSQQAYAFISNELYDWNLVNYFVTPIEVA